MCSHVPSQTIPDISCLRSADNLSAVISEIQYAPTKVSDPIPIAGEDNRYGP